MMTVIFIVLAVFVVLRVIAFIEKPRSIYKDDAEQQNPMEGKKVIFVENDSEPENADGVRGHLESIGESSSPRSFYNRFIKRMMDIILSFCGLVVLSPVFLIISIWIVIDDPGPILFTQKRIGRNKQYFKLHKFRSMRMFTPHDKPTHMLADPEQYITRAGRFIRAHSLDELPQIWDIWIGNMSIIGPRPGLWNQDLLVSYRDKYGANDIKPGLTGWAQINGRDELEIPRKAKLDGEYTSILTASGLTGALKALKMDIRCVIGTVFSVACGAGVVEGGTGKMKKQDEHEEIGT